MTMKWNLRALQVGIAAVSLMITTSPLLAGRSCETVKIKPAAIQNGFEAGLNLFHRLHELSDEKGQSPAVVLLGRVGSDLSKHGLRFSHMGFAVRDHPKGPYTIVHLLNHCAASSSDLYVEGLAAFFLDDPFAYDALLVVPSPELQQALAQRLLSHVPRRLHDSRYNMVAKPRSKSSQNSNQWVLEILVSALENADPQSSRQEIHQLPTMDSYHGDFIHIARWKRIGGIFQSNVDFLDQPLGNRLRNQYEIVTVRSVVDWLESAGHIAHREIVTPTLGESAANF